jgi:hypothetical protein
MAEGSRWWDKYYVRYFVGTVYAVPLLIALEKTSPAGSAIAQFAEDKWVNAAAVTTAGLAFCYLSSAPILLLHALRVRVPKTSTAFYATAITAAALGLTFLVVVVRSYIQNVDVMPSASLAIIPFAAVVALEVLGLATCSINSTKQFYVGLASQRKAESNSIVREDYTESYRHLREHGNALLIILMENILALGLWKAHDITMMVGLIVVWIFPATFVSFIATWLERALSDGDAV